MWKQTTKCFYMTWCPKHFSFLSILTGILGLKRSPKNKSGPDTFWWVNRALSKKHLLWMVKEWTSPSHHTSPSAAHLIPCSLNPIALSCVENDRAAIASRVTETFNRQLPITHLLITVGFSITLLPLSYPSSVSFFTCLQMTRYRGWTCLQINISSPAFRE